MKRLQHVDVLRGVAIMAMVIDHAYDWWLDPSAHASRLATVTEFIGTLAAPLFLYLVGVGLALSAKRAQQTGRPRPATLRYLLQRGGLLVLAGYALNLLIFYVGDNPADIWAIDVLHTIGLSIWVSLPFLWAPAWAALVLAVGTVALGVTGAGWHLPNPVAAVVTGTAEISYFPLLPWLPYTFLGLGIGKLICQTRSQGRLMGALAALGLLSLAVLPLVNPGWGYRHPRPVFVLFTTAVLLWLTAGLWLWVERGGRAGPVVRALEMMGRASLMLYVFHHLVGYRLFWLLGWVSGRSWRGEFGALGPCQATWALILLIGLMWGSSHLWLRMRHAERGKVR